MQELVALMEKWQPGISAGFVPTPEEEMARLVAIAGDLPGAYVRFLRTMGASTGDFQIDLGNADFGTNEMSLTWEAFPWLHKGRFVYLGQDNGQSAGDWFLDRRAPYGDDDCLVVNMTLEQEVDPAAAEPRSVGLEEFLYEEAFVGLRLPRFEHHRELRQLREGPESKWPKAEGVFAVAEQLGFARIPRVTHSGLFDRGDAAILVHRHPTRPTFTVMLSGDDKDAVDAWVDVLMKQAGVIVDEVRPR
jgi:hypothetical protein